MKKIRVATRESALAIAQTEIVKQKLLAAFPGLQVEIIRLTTEGDRNLETSLAKIGGKGLFVKELEKALFDGQADIAVHSMKDVPMALPAGLCIASMLKREDPRDAFVSNVFASFDELPKGAVIGTSSLRRQCQVLAQRPDLTVKVLRGNVQTRLKKLDEGDFDAIILAAAGLNRLNLSGRITHCFSAESVLPAAGQGAIGIECREGAAEMIALLKTLEDGQTACCVNAERAVSLALNASCQLPLAAFAHYKERQLQLNALVGEPDGRQIIRAESSTQDNDVSALSASVVKQLIDQGADKILRSL